MEQHVNEPVYDFTVVQVGTGRVMGSGRTMHSEGLAGEGEYVLENVKASLDEYYKNGEFLRYPEKPSPVFEFDYDTGVWYDPRSIDQLKADRWEQLKADRQAAIDAGVTVDGSRYQTTESSVAAVTSEYVLLDSQPDDWTIDWTLADNTVRTLTKPEFGVMAPVVMQHRSRCQAISQALRAQLFAPEINTPAEIESVRWPIP